MANLFTGIWYDAMIASTQRHGLPHIATVVSMRFDACVRVQGRHIPAFTVSDVTDVCNPL